MDRSHEAYINTPHEIEILKPKNLTIPLKNVNHDIGIPYFEKADILELLSKLPPNKHGILFQFLWRTGIRVSEVIRVKKCDLDFDNNEMTIVWLKNRKHYSRRLAMHQSLKMPLWSYTAHLLTNDLLFPYTRQYVHQLCRKYNFGHAHKIRHSFAVNFLRQRESAIGIIELKEILGHSNIKSTMEYLKVVPISQKKALAAINFD